MSVTLPFFLDLLTSCLLCNSGHILVKKETWFPSGSAGHIVHMKNGLNVLCVKHHPVGQFTAVIMLQPSVLSVTELHCDTSFDT